MNDQTPTATSTANDQPLTAVSGLYDLTEAARLTGVSVDALRKRASRGRLEQVKSNDGTVRVRLTTADIETLVRTSARQQATRPPTAGQTIEPVQTLSVDIGLHERAARAEGEVAVLREAIVRALDQADNVSKLAEGEAAVLREALARALAQVEAVTRQAETMSKLADMRRDEIAESRVAVARAEGEAACAKGEAAVIREALAEAQRPPWKRWFGI